MAGAALGSSPYAGNNSLKQMYPAETSAVADLEGMSGRLLNARLATATFASLVAGNDNEGSKAVLLRFDPSSDTASWHLVSPKWVAGSIRPLSSPELPNGPHARFESSPWVDSSLDITSR
jgi:hypothetical protein